MTTCQPNTYTKINQTLTQKSAFVRLRLKSPAATVCTSLHHYAKKYSFHAIPRRDD